MQHAFAKIVYGTPTPVLVILRLWIVCSIMHIALGLEAPTPLRPYYFLWHLRLSNLLIRSLEILTSSVYEGTLLQQNQIYFKFMIEACNHPLRGYFHDFHDFQNVRTVVHRFGVCLPKTRTFRCSLMQAPGIYIHHMPMARHLSRNPTPERSAGKYG
jgi:hypothetical protein